MSNDEIVKTTGDKLKLSPTDRKRCDTLLKLFDEKDLDGSGTLCLDECVKMFKNPCQAKEYFEFMNRDQRGGVSKKEFLAALHVQDKESQYRHMFNIADKDDDNKLTVDEIAKELNISPELADALRKKVKECDTNNDGKLSFEEFKQFMPLAICQL
ncbi:calcineurin subunit B-like [Tubulanus polymorphus]|uniref:calcineurin subunit B-like n=1 Tax=Tubulanus polymorphus TaxID=672921 RepID=UPI003DA67A4B